MSRLYLRNRRVWEVVTWQVYWLVDVGVQCHAMSCDILTSLCLFGLRKFLTLVWKSCLDQMSNHKVEEV